MDYIYVLNIMSNGGNIVENKGEGGEVLGAVESTSQGFLSNGLTFL